MLKRELKSALYVMVSFMIKKKIINSHKPPPAIFEVLLTHFEASVSFCWQETFQNDIIFNFEGYVVLLQSKPELF